MPRTAAPTILKLTAAFYPGENGWVIGEILEAKGVYTQGETLDEARDNLVESVVLMLETAPHQFRRRRRKAPVDAATETFIVILPPAT
jgi:predicted RNase H-like HicB family nuclease